MPLNFKPEADRCALLVFDMCNDFVAPGTAFEVPGAAAIVPNLKKLIAFCRSKNIPVIYTQHLVREDLSDIGLIGEIWPQIPELVRERRGFVKGAEGMEIYEPVKPGPEDVMIEKRRYSAFAHTDLDIVLKGKKRDTLIVTGVSTNIGPETTVRDAVVRDYKVIFVSDCTANKDIPDMGWGVIPADVAKKVTFSVLALAFCRVMDSSRLMAELGH
ncbi:MAG: isochorismatase family protein [Candidatus Binatia bacterium]